MNDDTNPWKKDWKEEQEIGRGGQGIVTELRHKSDPSRRAVLKCIVSRWKDNRQARERLRLEVETLSKLNNIGANVPTVYDSFLNYEATEPFLVMEFIKGVRFDEWLKTSAPVAPAKAVLVTQGIAETINLCHQNNIGHRDLKPSNIILKNGEIDSPYILDFGIAFDSKQTMILTKEGEIFRNEFINLPECQDLEGGHRDLRSDITALAGIFFTCLTGRPPILLRDAQERAPHQRHERLLMGSAETNEQGERLSWFFDRAFKYRIEERFQYLDEFITELDRFAKSSPEESLDLYEQFSIFDQKVRSLDRNVQLSTLRKKYKSLLSKVNSEMQNKLKRIMQQQGQVSQVNCPIAGIRESSKPKLNGGDLLDKGSLRAFTVTREDYQFMAVVLIAAFGVGMEIHLYSTSYCTRVGSPQLTSSLTWSKIATIDEHTNDLSGTKLSVIVDALMSKLAREISNLVPRKE